MKIDSHVKKASKAEAFRYLLEIAEDMPNDLRIHSMLKYFAPSARKRSMIWHGFRKLWPRITPGSFYARPMSMKIKELSDAMATSS